MRVNYLSSYLCPSREDEVIRLKNITRPDENEQKYKPGKRACAHFKDRWDLLDSSIISPGHQSSLLNIYCVFAISPKREREREISQMSPWVSGKISTPEAKLIQTWNATENSISSSELWKTNLWAILPLESLSKIQYGSVELTKAR